MSQQHAAAATSSKTAGTTTSTISDFAVTQLRRMGWTEGTGLGKEKTGRAEPLTVTQRADAQAGLGREEVAHREQLASTQDQWWMEAVGGTLAKLSGGSATTTKIPTDADLFAATGGARFGMRAGKTRNVGKWKRTNDNDDHDATQRAAGTDTSSSRKRKRRDEETSAQKKERKQKKREKKEKKKKKKDKRTKG